jgi:alkaline phosphatase D
LRTPVALVLTFVLFALAAAPASARPSAFRLGVTAGEVTSSSAIVWGKANRTGRVRLVVARNRALTRARRRFRLRALRRDDATVQKRVRGLGPGRRYWYRFYQGRGRSARGTFRTAPGTEQDRLINFAWSGDTDFNSAPGQSYPYWNLGEVFRAMKNEGNTFNIHFGDTIYSDSEIPGRLHPIALTVGQKWDKYKINLKNRQLRALRNTAGFYSHWDDHEFVNDFSQQESTFSNGVNIRGQTLYGRGLRAFRDYAPVNYSNEDGIYRTFRWGKNLEMFFLDQRSFRSAKADDNGRCDNPTTHAPDVAPTAPQSTRTIFGAGLPTSGLNDPVSPSCLQTIRDPRRTYLGRRQMERFKQAIAQSDARFKVIMNELPIQQYYILPYDRWEGYEAERQEMLHFLRDRGIKNTIFLTTDVHATLVNDARFQTLESGGAKNSGFTDFTVGSAATENFEHEIDGATHTEGAGKLADNFFLEPDPPLGVGMRCSSTDTFSYGHVRVSNSRLIVDSRDKFGNTLPDCAPLELRYQP